MKYRFDKDTGQVVEKPESRPDDVIHPLPPLDPQPDWFVKIYEEYLEQVCGGSR